MTYQQAVDYILGIPKFTTKNSLEHTRELLDELEIDEKRRKIVHVAGTNGKGSVCVYLDAMLRAQGKSAGLFISPHLIRMNERIVINGQQISDDEFTEVFEVVHEKVGELERQGFSHPTFFEFLFCMAMTAFCHADVEYIILETGLGGRLDATNVIKRPACCVITSIGRDHMRFLGDTVEEIAAEKAGIIKAGVPVAFMENGAGSDGVIERRASEVGAPCKKIGKNAFEISGTFEKYIAFSLASQYYESTTWKLCNTAPYQVENASLALAVMRLLFPRMASQTDALTQGKLPPCDKNGRFGTQTFGDCPEGEIPRIKKWQQALADVVWQGRMEEVRPGIYVDGAHNISAVERFVQMVATREGRKMILFSAVADKEYEKMIACLCTLSDVDSFVVTQIVGERSVDVQTLAALFAKYTDKPVVVEDAPDKAWDYVVENQDKRTVYCLGSLYLAGMLKECMEDA